MTVFYSKEAQFILSDDEFKAFMEAAKGGKKVWIPRLKVFLSDMFIWAGEKPDQENKPVRLHDGLMAFRDKWGAWRPLNNPDSKIDLRYYPELTKDDDIKKLKP